MPCELPRQSAVSLLLRAGMQFEICSPPVLSTAANFFSGNMCRSEWRVNVPKPMVWVARYICLHMSHSKQTSILTDCHKLTWTVLVLRLTLLGLTGAQG